MAMLLAWFLAVSASAAAHQCPPDWKLDCSIPGEIRDSRAVAIVQVVGMQALHNDEGADDYTGGDLFTLVPVEVLKGSLPARFVLISDYDSGGFPLEPGRRYLLFLDRDESAMTWRITRGWRGNSGPLAERKATLQRVRERLAGR